MDYIMQHCVIYEGRHTEGICNKCYLTFSEQEKERYVKCEHFKTKLIE